MNIVIICRSYLCNILYVMVLEYTNFNFTIVCKYIYYNVITNKR